MKKIETLTKEQEALIPVYLKKWLDNGYSTTPLDRAKAEASVTWLYEFSNHKTPDMWFCDSPMQAQLIINIIQTGRYDDKSFTETHAELSVKTIPELRAILGATSLTYAATFSPALWSYWVGFYDYVLNVLFPGEREKFKVFNTVCKYFYMNTHLLVAFENVCFISERPVKVKTKTTANGNILHSDAGPALAYKDGYGLSALNGVIMPEWVTNQPKENLKSQDIIKIPNAEQRMQAMKHKGMGHFFLDLETKVIDAKDGYELLLVNHSGEWCEYLKMINPSTGEIHLEGVRPGTTTVDAARTWRNALQYWINPMSLT